MGEPLVKAEKRSGTTVIVSDARTLGGMAVVSGTRVPAATIAAYLRAGHSIAEIRADYPSLPADGIEAVEAWAVGEYGPDWRSPPAHRGA